MSVTPEIPSGTTPSVRRRVSPRLLGLAVVIGILAVLGVGALADALAVAPLRPPTQAGESQRAGLYTLAMTVSPEPLSAGVESDFTLRVTNVSGAAVNGARVTCDYTMPAMPMPVMFVTATRAESGAYTCRQALSEPGAWALTVTLTPPDSASVHTTFTLQAR